MELYKAIIDDKCPKRDYIRETLAHIIHTIDVYTPSGVSLCYNGGKDCTVLLHLLAAAFAFKGVPFNSIPVVYFKIDDEFDEIHVFNRAMSSFYGFTISEYTDSDMKKCLQKMLDDYPNVRAIFMGQRKGDPGGAYIGRITKSDPTWPQIDRVNSIIDWSYSQVWKFLIDFHLPYCKLYELGYTSLGTKTLTLPNPLLLKPWAGEAYCDKYFPPEYAVALNRILAYHRTLPSPYQKSLLDPSGLSSSIASDSESIHPISEKLAEYRDYVLAVITKAYETPPISPKDAYVTTFRSDLEESTREVDGDNFDDQISPIAPFSPGTIPIIADNDDSFVFLNRNYNRLKHFTHEDCRKREEALEQNISDHGNSSSSSGLCIALASAPLPHTEDNGIIQLWKLPFDVCHTASISKSNADSLSPLPQSRQSNSGRKKCSCLRLFEMTFQPKSPQEVHNEVQTHDIASESYDDELIHSMSSLDVSPSPSLSSKTLINSSTSNLSNELPSSLTSKSASYIKSQCHDVRFDRDTFFSGHEGLTEYNRNSCNDGIVEIQGENVLLRYWPYLPGFLLEMDSCERDGRLAKIKKPFPEM